MVEMVEEEGKMIFVDSTGNRVKGAEVAMSLKNDLATIPDVPECEGIRIFQKQLLKWVEKFSPQFVLKQYAKTLSTGVSLHKLMKEAASK